MLQQILATKFGCLTTAPEVTQYLRGRLFVYVDFLMANEYKDPQKEIPLVVNFFYLVIKVIACWLDLLPNYLQSVLIDSFNKR